MSVQLKLWFMCESSVFAQTILTHPYSKSLKMFK